MNAEAQQLSPDLRDRLLSLSRRQKCLLQIASDTCLIWAALWLAFFIRLDSAERIEPFSGHAWLFLLAPALSIPLFFRFGLYRAVMRYLGNQAIMTVFQAVSASAAVLALAVYLHGHPPAVIPRSVIIIHWMLCLMFIGGVRIAMWQYFTGVPFTVNARTRAKGRRPGDDRKRVLLYGAGSAGNQLLGALRAGREMLPLAFIDDNPELANRSMAGLPIYGPERLPWLIEETDAEEILLAIPSASRKRRNEIIDMLARYAISVRTLPGLTDLASGRVKVEELREVDIGDLLGRDPVEPRTALFERCIKEQVVMVTGAGGSIGSELCRQIVRCRPAVLILFEHSEYALYSIQKELDNYVRKQALDLKVVPVLGSVRNQRRLYEVMTAWGVDTVYHAAAYKHVPMVEHNIAEGIFNNTFGTLFTAQAALRARVRNFVLISTDKAVRPTNVMGSTKRLAELVLQALAAERVFTPYGTDGWGPVRNETRYTMVRFGNVLGSSGSVIPLFREQIRRGGPVTVTHPEMTRYFMTIPEAAQLVIQAGSMGAGGDVFVLDMGKSVKIAALAEKMIQLSGLSVRSKHDTEGDIAIEYTGLRPGEKLYEELLIGENVTDTEHPMIMRANEASLNWATLGKALEKLESATKSDDYQRVRELLLQLVDGYRPETDIVDVIHLQKHAASQVTASRGRLRSA